MRWNVEVTSIGRTDKETFSVEADSWQRALQQTRAMRNDLGPMSGFSIELLDDGCRAVDPMSRLRYEVRKVEESTVTTVAAPPAPAAAVSPPASPDAAPAATAAAAPRAPSGQPPPTARKATMAFGSSGAAVVQEAIAEAKKKKNESVRPPPPAAQPAAEPPPAVARPLPAIHPMERTVVDQDGPTQVHNNAVGLPRAQVIFKREEEPNERAPLTYREYVYAVESGTDETAAERLLNFQLDEVRRSLEGARPGKLVNLAVFDVVFRGRPPVPPLATLAWKDWRGAPAITFPRRAPAKIDARRAPAPVHPSAAPAQIPAQASFGAAPQPAFPAPHAPAPVALGPTATLIASPSAAPLPPVAFHPPSTAPVGFQPPPPAPVAFQPPPPAPVAFQPPPPAPAVFQPPPPALEPAPPLPPPPAALPVVGFPQAPAPVAAHAPPPAALAKTVLQPSPPVRAPTPSRGVRAARGGRIPGDELIADLFEAMHDLHFVKDAVEGGEFCLTLAAEKLPSFAGIVHLYDIDRREFVITSTRGPGSERLLLQRHGESDPLLSAAMRKRRAVVLSDATTSEAAGLERFTALGGAKSVIVAPVMQAGRFLGAIELLNPLDGAPFTEDEGNALTYIGEQFAEFVATRGVVTDPERISQRPGARA